MGFKDFNIRSYNGQIDRARVEDLERRCAVGPSEEQVFFTDSMGDPICRIRNSPMYNYLVAELDNELVGVVQGTIKIVTLHVSPCNKDFAKVGYILGLRVSPPHREKGIGSSLVRRLEEWFVSNQVDYAYMVTEEDNKASVNLFTNKLGFVKFRAAQILVNPVNNHSSSSSSHLSSSIEIAKLKIDQAEYLYRTFMGSTEFFPHDIDRVLRHKLSLGTWVAYFRGESWGELLGESPNSWAMLSVWNSGEVFKLRMGKETLFCYLYEIYSRLIQSLFPCFKLVPDELPDFFDPFGFYFLYGVHHVGPSSGKLVRALCEFVRDMAKKCEDCKALVTEIGVGDTLKLHIPHWKLLSCPKDLWCIKPLRSGDRDEEVIRSIKLRELTPQAPPTRALFVDPREV